MTSIVDLLREDDREPFSDGIFLLKDADDGVEISELVVSIHFKEMMFGANGTAFSNSIPSKLVVPEELSGLPVVALGKYALFGQGAIEEVELPQTMREIHRGAFDCCFNLKSLRIPAETTFIEETALAQCPQLRKIVVDPKNECFKVRNGSLYNVAEGTTLFRHIPQSENETEVVVPNGVEKIGACAFASYDKLKRIALPASVSEIDSCAFLGCSALERVDVSRNNLYFRSHRGALFSKFSSTLVFCPPTNKRKKIVVPDSVAGIVSGAFSDLAALEEIVLPDSWLTVEANAFVNCLALKTARLPRNALEILPGAFANCMSVEKIEIPDSATKIGMLAFMNCISLREVRFPKGLAEIELGAFYACSGLKNVELPDGVVEIGKGAFMRCAYIKTIAVPESVERIGKLAFPRIAKLRLVKGSYADEWAQSQNWAPKKIEYV